MKATSKSFATEQAISKEYLNKTNKAHYDILLEKGFTLASSRESLALFLHHDFTQDYPLYTRGLFTVSFRHTSGTLYVHFEALPLHENSPVECRLFKEWRILVLDQAASWGTPNYLANTVHTSAELVARLEEKLGTAKTTEKPTETASTASQYPNVHATETYLRSIFDHSAMFFHPVLHEGATAPSVVTVVYRGYSLQFNVSAHPESDSTTPARISNGRTHTYDFVQAGNKDESLRRISATKAKRIIDIIIGE